MATEAEVIEVQFRAVGNAEVATAFDQVSASSVKAEGKVLQFDRSLDKLNQGAAKGTRLFGALATSASSLDSSFGKLGSAAARTSETVMSFGTYLGGPWGIALGLAVAGVSLFSQHLAENKKAAEEAAAALERYAKAEADREARKATDPFLAALRARAEGASDAAEFERIKKAYEDRAGGSTDALYGEGVFANGGKGAAKIPDVEFQTSKRRDETAKRLADLDAQEARAREESTAEMLRHEQEASRKVIEYRQQRLDAQFSAENEFRAQNLAADAEFNAKRAEMAKANGDVMRGVGVGTVQAVAGASLDALQKIAKGQKLSTRAVLEGIGDQIAAIGRGHILQGIAMEFIPLQQANAAGLIAAGAAEYAFGVGLGAAAARGGGGGGGGSRGAHAGGGESGDAYLDRTRASSPSARPYGSAGGSGQTIVVTNNFHSTFAPSPDDALRMQKSWDEGARAGVVPRRFLGAS